MKNRRCRKPCANCGLAKEGGAGRKLCLSCHKIWESRRDRCHDCGKKVKLGQGRRWCKQCVAKRTGDENGKYKLNGHLRSLWNRYRLRSADYYAMMEKQHGLCAICNHQCSSGQALAVDHSHETGQVRGLLCKRCNMAIHYLENSGWRSVADEYLRKCAPILAAETELTSA